MGTGRGKASQNHDAASMERRFPFYREGQPLDRPAGWDVFDPNGRWLRREWNPERHLTEFEKGVLRVS